VRPSHTPRPPPTPSAGETRRHDAQAVTYFRKAGDADIANGCFNLGVMYLDGRGVARSRDQARDLFARACQDGDQNACKTERDLAR
jgi:uncharacterized protein